MTGASTSLGTWGTFFCNFLVIFGALTDVSLLLLPWLIFYGVGKNFSNPTFFPVYFKPLRCCLPHHHHLPEHLHIDTTHAWECLAPAHVYLHHLDVDHGQPGKAGDQEQEEHGQGARGHRVGCYGWKVKRNSFQWTGNIGISNWDWLKLSCWYEC